jgi:hypothetical protein
MSNFRPDIDVCRVNFESNFTKNYEISKSLIEVTRKAHSVKVAKNAALGQPNHGTMPDSTKAGVVPWKGQPGTTFLAILPPCAFQFNSIHLKSVDFKSIQVQMTDFDVYFKLVNKL